MTPAGWTIMLTSVSTIFLWCAYCIYRVLTLPPQTVRGHFHSPLELEAEQIERDP